MTLKYVVHSGEEFHNVRGDVAISLGSAQYAHDYVQVQFVDTFAHVIKVRADCLVNGILMNPYNRSINGKGYLGVGPHRPSNKKHKLTPMYRSWLRIIAKCYTPNPNSLTKYYMCDEWLNFQTYAQWHIENYKNVPFERLTVVGGQPKIKIYSPSTCKMVIPKKYRRK